MKKFFLFLTLLIGSVGVTWADTWSYANSITIGDQITDLSTITDGQAVVLKQVSSSAYTCYGTSMVIKNSTTTNGLSVFKLHPTGTTNQFTIESAARSGYYFPSLQNSDWPTYVMTKTSSPTAFTFSSTTTASVALSDGQFIIGCSTGYFDGSSTAFTGWQGKGSNCQYQVYSATLGSETTEVNLPDGENYYLLKGALSGKYLTANGTSLTLNADKTPASLFYLTSDFALQAKGTSYYANNSAKNLSTTKYAGEISAGTYGTSAGSAYFYKNNSYYMFGGTSSSQTTTDRGSSVNGEGYQWYFEKWEDPSTTSEFTTTGTALTTAPTEGYYVVQVYSKNTKGYLTYNSSLTRKFRASTTASLDGTLDNAIVWQLAKNSDGSFTLKNVAAGVYVPADATRNSNCSGTETANIMLESLPTSDYAQANSWFGYQTNYKNGDNKLYFHCNGQSDGYGNNLSYWDGNGLSDGGSVCQIAFIPATMTGGHTLTFNYKEGETTVATKTLVLKENAIYEAPALAGYKFDAVTGFMGGEDKTIDITVTKLWAITLNYTYNGSTFKTATVLVEPDATIVAPAVQGYTFTALTQTATADATVEVPCTPLLPYQYYYIANDNENGGSDIKLQLSDEGGTLKAATTGTRTVEKYIWKRTVDADGYYQFQNLATGKYLKHKGVQDAAYNFRLDDGLATGNYALWGVSDSKHLCIKYDGTLDQADGTYAKGSTDYSTDFIFEQAVINTLTINTTPAVAGVFTWNGETKRGANVTYTKIAGQTVTDKSVTAFDNGYTASLSASEWDGESDLAITATMAESFYSTNYGEKWVRISSAVNSNYVMSAGAETTNMATANVDVTSDSQLFCFVGNATDGFKIYSKTKGSSVALYTADTNSGTAPSWTDAASASTWFLDSKYLSADSQPGYGLTTQDVTTSSDRNSLNLWGGGTGEAKFYGNGSSNGGSRWTVNEVEDLTLTVACTGTKSDMNQLVGSFSYTADGVTTSTNVTYATLDKSSTMYLPKAKSLTVNASSFVTYPGYEFVSQTYADNVLTVNYKATDARWLFQTYGHGRPYRIPAITKARNNDLIAVSDDRFCGADIGNGRVDLVYKVSHDNGATWSAETMLAQGDGVSSSNTCGFGDAAIVADRTSDKVMVMCVSAPNGGTCWTAAQRSSILWGTPNSDGTWTWTTPVDFKDEIMALLPTDRVNYFVGSGKLHQSRYIKVGDYYRVYAALWTTAGSDINNYVVYSDNFGAAGSWKLLGTTDVCPGPNGNEPKCEELPDGSVLLSARQPYHRLHNIFTYTDAATGAGSWGTSATGIANNDGPNGTDGEILIVNAMRASDGKVVPMGLQSAPNNGRAKVSIWYKDLSTDNAYDTPANFGTGWTLGKQMTPYSSAYTTMILQGNSKIGFFYEDGQSGAGYDMIYVPLTLEELTDNAYSLTSSNLQTTSTSTSTAVVLEGDVTNATQVADIVPTTATSVDLTAATVPTDKAVTIEQIKDAVVAKTGNANTILYTPAGTTVQSTTTNVVVDGKCQSLVVTDGNAFAAPTAFTATVADYVRTMTSQWGTLCLPYDIKADHKNASYDLYTISESTSDELTLARVDDGTVAAGTPVIVYRDGAATGIDMNNSNASVATGVQAGTKELVGCHKDTPITSGYYISNNAFWNAAEVSGGVTVPAFRAYINKVGDARTLTIRVAGGEETGIEALNSMINGTATYYDANGRQLKQAQQGVNIIRTADGKTHKVILK